MYSSVSSVLKQRETAFYFDHLAILNTVIER